MVGTGMAIGMAVQSGVQAKKAAESIEQKKDILGDQLHANRDIFESQYYQNMTDRTEIQDILKKLRENQQTERERDNAQAAALGLSAEQRLAQTEARNRTTADTISNIATKASMLKDSYLNNWQAQQNNYFAGRLGLQNELANIYMNRSGQTSTASTNLFNTSAPMLARGIDSLVSSGSGSVSSSGMAAAMS